MEATSWEGRMDGRSVRAPAQADRTTPLSALRAPARWRARWHGWRDGRLGLTVEEAADAPYLTALAATIAARQRQSSMTLTHQLATLDPLIVELLAELDRRITERGEVVASSQAVVQDLENHYRGLAAHYGAAFVRHHRDRGFVRLGWRTPSLPAGPWRAGETTSTESTTRPRHEEA